MIDTPLDRLVSSLGKTRILVVGDVMLDRYVYGRVERVSYEAPIPVLSVTREESMPGGAGNVARNLAALGGRADLIGLVGEDATAAEIRSAFAAVEGWVTATLIGDDRRPTTLKTRYVANGQQLLRADRESTLSATADQEDRIIGAARDTLAAADALVLSDYAKGTLTDRVIAECIAAARARAKPVVVDPKARDFSRYRGADIIKPNRAELALALGQVGATDEELIAAAPGLLERCGIAAMLLTRAEAGMSLIAANGEALHLPADARDIFDVSGAGDTVVATLAAGLAAGGDAASAARLASLAAGIVVGKVGTAVVHPGDLREALARERDGTPSRKILDADRLQERVRQWRAEGLRIGFANGCFDLVHPGHLALIEQARAACDRLILAINSDESVRRLKGEGRPVQLAAARARVLAALGAVDAVTIFADDTPVPLLERLRPDVLVKGADYAEDQVVGGDLVKGYGGRILLADLQPGHSTTATIARLGRR